MNSNFTFKLFSVFLFSGLILFASCSKEEDTTNGNNSTPAKTLNKTTMTPKKWYSEGSAFIHDLKAGGIYGSKGGSWKWKNNSDTLTLVLQSGYPETYWKVYWNTSTEMECEKVGTFTKLLYKDVAW